MIHSNQHVLVVLTVGKSDNGKSATMAFSCGLSALALGQSATVFLTSDGAVWAFHGSASDIRVQGFAPLVQLIQQFIDDGGSIVACSVCHTTCGIGSPEMKSSIQTMDSVEVGGFATILERSMGGLSVTF